MRRAVLAVLLSLLAGASAMAALPPADTDTAAWFERFKAEATDEELYRFLYAMPKGGDLHNHLSGSILSEWFYDLALQQAERGYRYYTRVRIENCRPYGGNAFVESPYLLMFVTIQESTFQALDACEQSEYRPLEALDAAQKQAWLDSLRLEKPWEGRDEFFQTHWQRMGDLYRNPYLAADALLRNMQAFADEGLMYLESMIGVLGFIDPGARTSPRTRWRISIERRWPPRRRWPPVSRCACRWRSCVSCRMPSSTCAFFTTSPFATATCSWP
jgi:adenosine deaminase CECR1